MITGIIAPQTNFPPPYNTRRVATPSVGNPFKKLGKFSYVDEGKGEPVILLHGLFGSVANFSSVIAHLKKTHRVIMPELPIYSLGLNISVAALTDYIHQFVLELNLQNIHLVGNSLGGHIALLYTLRYQENVKSLVLVGSSGLYENGIGDTFPKRGDYNYIKAKTEKTFFKPETATKELVDEIFETVNNRTKAIQILYLAKSTIKYNLKSQLNSITVNCSIIWGKQDAVTPPDVATEFKRLISHASLYWIDNCGHVPMMETPNEFNKLLSKHLNRVSETVFS